MRIIAIGLLTLCVVLPLSETAQAELLKAIRPGVMCASADALAKLTLHNGSSRSAGGDALPKYKEIAKAGGCISIEPNIVVTTISIRKNTSIVSYHRPDGTGDGTFYIPNIDFAHLAPPDTVFYQEIRRKCPGKLDGLYLYDSLSLVDMQSMFIATLPKVMQYRIADAVHGACKADRRCDYAATADEEARLHLEAKHADFLCALQGFPTSGAH